MKKGFANLVGVFVGLMIVILIGVSVVIPTIQQAISASNLTGISATLLELIPLLIAIAILLIIISVVQPPR
ncbi:MAG: hypothetical protein QXS37_00860 [Candidatus Aenigmatarchaeota archaeon]